MPDNAISNVTETNTSRIGANPSHMWPTFYKSKISQNATTVNYKSGMVLKIIHYFATSVNLFVTIYHNLADVYRL